MESVPAKGDTALHVVVAMRIVTYNELFEEPAGRLFAPWEGSSFGHVWVLGEHGPQGQLMVRDLFAVDNDARQLLADGGRASVRHSGMVWLQKGEDNDQFVVFDVRDISALLPTVQHAASRR